MSLIIRRVKNISRKKRKSRSRIRQYSKDEFEDESSKFTVSEEIYSEDFPPLRPVYRKEIFGTPIVFRVTNGIDFYGDIAVNIKTHSITFMREYNNKSFEELRREDYSCGRKEILHYEENSYLKSVSAKSINKIINYEFFDPVPKNIPPSLSRDKSLLSIFRNANCALDNMFSKTLPKPNDSLSSSMQSSKSFDDVTDSSVKFIEKSSLLTKDDSTFDSQTILKSHIAKVAEEKTNNKQRSILTYVGKLSQTMIRMNPLTKNSSDLCVNTRSEGYPSKHESIEILRTNLVRYFETAEPTATIHYDLITQNPKFYLPCAEIGFVYQNARPSTRLIKKSNDPKQNKVHRLKSKLEHRGFGYDKENNYNCENTNHIDELAERKYSSSNKFNKDYFRNKFNPYSHACRSAKCSRCKYILAGKDIIA